MLTGFAGTGVGTRARLDSSPEQAEERLQKLAGAVKIIFECIGEDPEREGLRETPERYAKALMYFTKGYEENVRDLVNGAVFHEDHDELVIVKDIEVFSLCEHHMVPFTGKVEDRHPPSSFLMLTNVHRCISVTFLTAGFWAFPSSLAWQRCFHGDYKSKNVLRNKSLSLLRKCSNRKASRLLWSQVTCAWSCGAFRRPLHRLQRVACLVP